MTVRSERRPNPDELLRRVQAEERRDRRGRLKIFLGYAPRVGKSLRMFDEGRRRKERGQDVVIAAAQGDVPESVREIVSRLETIPALDGSIDLPSVLRRRPAVCLIDQLSFNNPPGSRNPERWQDVEEILHNGIANPPTPGCPGGNWSPFAATPLVTWRSSIPSRTGRGSPRRSNEGDPGSYEPIAARVLAWRTAEVSASMS